MRKITVLIAALAALGMLATSAFAAVSIDADGFGSVGKGDVQLAFGWNNATYQKNASAVSFTAELVDTYEITCEDVNKKGETTIKTREKDNSVSGTPVHDLRTKNQIVGWTLNGWSSSKAKDNTQCKDGETQTGETLISSTTTVFAHHNGQKVALQ